MTLPSFLILYHIKVNGFVSLCSLVELQHPHQPQLLEHAQGTAFLVQQGVAAREGKIISVRDKVEGKVRGEVKGRVREGDRDWVKLKGSAEDNQSTEEAIKLEQDKNDTALL